MYYHGFLLSVLRATIGFLLDTRKHNHTPDELMFQ